MSPSGPDQTSFEIDTSVAHAARVYDYLLGGTSNFEVDRVAARRQTQAIGGIDNARAQVRANRDFLGRAIRWLAGEAGIRQVLDIGTGIPNADNVHAIAQQVAPESRIVCVDYDPIVVAHAHELMTSTSEGSADFVHGDVRHPDQILAQAAATLDLSRPTALVMLGLLYLIPDSDDPYGIVRHLVDALAPGSYLAISHITGDFNPEMAELVERLNETMAEPFILRSQADIARFFDGLELVEPEVVPVNQWRPDPGQPADPHPAFSAYLVGVARKP